MQPGIFAKTFEETGAVPVLQAVAASGYQVAQFNFACVGLPPMPDTIPDALVQEIAGATRTTGVQLAAISGTYNMIHPDPAVRVTGLRRLEEMARQTRALGSDLITLCTGTRDAQDQWRWHADNATPQAWADLLAAMEAAIAIAERHDIRLGIEPELANVVSDAPAARRLLDEMKSDRLCIVLDPANLFEVADARERQGLIERAVDLLADDIAMAHAKDRAADGSFVAAGEGVIDFRHFIAQLRRGGFDGPLVTHGLSAAQAPGVARFLAGVLAGDDAS